MYKGIGGLSSSTGLKTDYKYYEGNDEIPWGSYFSKIGLSDYVSEYGKSKKSDFTVKALGWSGYFVGLVLAGVSVIDETITTTDYTTYTTSYTHPMFGSNGADIGFCIGGLVVAGVGLVGILGHIVQFPAPPGESKVAKLSNDMNQQIIAQR